MKVTMIAAPFGQGGQMHIHCRRYLRLLQLAPRPLAQSLAGHDCVEKPAVVVRSGL